MLHLILIIVCWNNSENSRGSRVSICAYLCNIIWQRRRRLGTRLFRWSCKFLLTPPCGLFAFFANGWSIIATRAQLRQTISQTHEFIAGSFDDLIVATFENTTMIPLPAVKTTERV